MRSRKPRGFTILELTIALSLMVILMGLVVIRLGFGSAHRRTLDAARKVGNLFSTYREKAMSDECLYALRIDAATGQYAVFQPPERNAAMLETLSALKSATLPTSIKFGKILSQGKELSSPVVVFFDSKGLLTDITFEVASENGVTVVLHPDPLINEIYYDDR